jgi:hypothetical protein
MQASVTASPLHEKYAAAIDRESAREMLAKRLEAGAAKAEAEADARADAQGEKDGRADGDHASYPRTGSKPRSRSTSSRSSGSSGSQDSVVTEVLKSQAAKEFMRTAAREIARGVFGIGRR